MNEGWPFNPNKETRYYWIDEIWQDKEEPLAVPAENAKPKVEKSPKKRSSRLTSEQKRQNRAKRAKDERRAKRALVVDAHGPTLG